MARVTKVICDVCEAEKGSTNHWYLASFSGASFVIERYRDMGVADAIACGRHCVDTLVSRWMDGKPLVAEKAAG